jgi:hypothetical protein
MPEDRQHVLQSILVQPTHGELQLAWVAGHEVAAEDRWSFPAFPAAVPDLTGIGA